VQVTIFQVATSPIGIFPKVRLGVLRRSRLQWGPSAAARLVWGRALRQEWASGRALRLGQTWEVAAKRIAQLGSCYLRKYLWESSKHRLRLIVIYLFDLIPIFFSSLSTEYKSFFQTFSSTF